MTVHRFYLQDDLSGDLVLAVQNLCICFSLEQFNLHLASMKIHCCQQEQQQKACLEICPGAPRSEL